MGEGLVQQIVMTETPSPHETADSVLPEDMPPLPDEKKAAAAPAPKSPPEDPTWWRLGSVPFLVLVMAAAAADLAWPRPAGMGLGAGLGCLLACAALLMLRKDFTKGEGIFLGTLGVINFAALLVSGNPFNWWCNLILPFIMVILPKRQEALRPGQNFRNWWSYWVSSRLKTAANDAGSRLAGLRSLLPLTICILVGASLFFAFLTIFATGNPVVNAVREWLADAWNSLIAYLPLSWDFLLHILYWFVGIVWFGIYTFRRPNTDPDEPPAAQPKPAGSTILPHLPICSLIGINLAFFIATSTDVAYLWLGRVPEGISQTAYLYNGAASIAWASALAAGILIYLFRRTGSSRRSTACRLTGYLLVLQTFLLAVSVYMRLYYQIDAFGFTIRRIMAAEAMLLGTTGLAVLVCYMAGNGAFRQYAKVCLASMLLLLIAFSIYSPARLAGNMNLCYAPTHPHWSFSYTDFYSRHRPFKISENLAFACYVQEKTPNEFLAVAIHKEAEKIERRAAKSNWLSWNFTFAQDAEAASRVLSRPVKIHLTGQED